MPFVVSLPEAQQAFPEYTFVRGLTPSEQKAAFHVQNQQGYDLCLKIISPAYERDRLDREIQALQFITHPNVVRLFEYTFSSRPGSQRHFIVEEFVAGADLTDHLHAGAAWEPTRAATFFAALCDGLAELRRHDIVHRDIKPQNIRVRPNGDPVLIDFGVARHLRLPALTRTVDGAGIGTPLYFAPEQFAGTKYDIDHRTDLFAVGVLLYEALTGTHPFCAPDTATYEQLATAVCEGAGHTTNPAFAALDPKWRILVARLLEKERAKRPADAAQVAAMLRKLGGQ